MIAMPVKHVLKQIENYQRNVKIELLKRGITQRRLAKILGEDYVEISKAISFYQEPRFKRIRKEIDKYLGIKE
ncbi:hypothetical protein IV37_GL000031 [Fructilactobacillus fructivorans]|nr:hypothetical protein FC73_GL000029 [Fructilactobacillus fructivorans]KRN13320.1 hypothetical protein IV37_GL000031 [Fructilactobacillus fructivorans]KRN40029.1 hypothetical protein IV51_GL000206 [Fructilactobacillus fructivorans]